ncbi:MAG TPA: ATP-binding protein [Gaiellaceae bacterium]|nr:ATP-binding protein [Gaiellaceae bacterium]
MSSELERLRRTEIWIAWVRVFAVPFAAFEVAVVGDEHPPGYERWGWATAAALTLGAFAFFWLAHRDLDRKGLGRIGFLALAFDTAIVYAFVFVYTFEPSTPAWGILYIPVIEGALRYGVKGGALVPVVVLPLVFLAEWWRAEEFGPPPFDFDHVTLPFGLQILIGLVVGWLVDRLRAETAVAEARAAEAEDLRDRLGHRADVLEAVNRAARALGSSLDQEQAFAAFRDELASMVAYDRLRIDLAGEAGPVFASCGGSPGREGAEEVVAPLGLADRTLGTLTVARDEGPPFTSEEVEMVTLLASQVAVAVENIRVYEAERSAAEELRRLSALRADFVSMVSHELRAPMASVIGCAQTLNRRWRELTQEQRESFLALIESETSRLSDLVGDVLDTSRIEAGTFPYAFDRVDVEELVRETAAVVSLGQDEVRVTTRVPPALPPVQGDRERLRQLLWNLLANAVKYTVDGDEVEVAAASEDGIVAVSVRDHGPGIPAEAHRLIFEKFGRVSQDGHSKPGAGLGLYIARSIAEAHGGSLDVESETGAGATFTVRLPLAGA